MSRPGPRSASGCERCATSTPPQKEIARSTANRGQRRVSLKTARLAIPYVSVLLATKTRNQGKRRLNPTHPRHRQANPSEWRRFRLTLLPLDGRLDRAESGLPSDLTALCPPLA